MVRARETDGPSQAPPAQSHDLRPCLQPRAGIPAMRYSFPWGTELWPDFRTHSVRHKRLILHRMRINLIVGRANV